MEAAVLWTVLWFVFISLGTWVITAGFGLVAVAAEQIWLAVVGWVLGIGWGIFALVKFIIQAIDLVKLIAAGG